MATTHPKRIGVAVLGCTGMVGQRFAVLLANHPSFHIVALGASSRSAGKPYGLACQWKLSEPMPQALASMIVQQCSSPSTFPPSQSTCPIIFSALDASVAGEIEMAFVQAEYAVFSNAKNHRMHPLVPLIVPLVNPDHMAIIPTLQRPAFGIQRGLLITNANCSTTGLSVALKALQSLLPLSKVIVTTMQAISGAGYPGVPALDILGNVVPYISGEEEKIEEELVKILGSCIIPENASSLPQPGESNQVTAFIPCPALCVSASCNRVPVLDGHTESVHVEFALPNDQSATIPTVKEVAQAFVSFGAQKDDNQSNVIVVRSEPDRPQPRLDVQTGAGMTVTVGRIRPCPIFHVKFTLLAHNTVLGAAGSAILNAEIAVAKGLVSV